MLTGPNADALEVKSTLNKLAEKSEFGVRDLTRQYRIFQEQDAAGEPETHHDVAQLLIQGFTEEDGVAPVACEGSIYRYQDGLWIPTALPKVETIISEKFNTSKACRRKNDYRQIAAHVYDLLDDPEFFHDAPTGIATDDGFFSIDDKGELQHQELTHKRRQRFRLKAIPRKGGMPKFRKHLRRCFAGSVKPSTDLLQEIFGTALFGLLPKKHRVAMFIGPGRTGKSTTLNILAALIDRRYQSATTPYRWDSEYYIAALAGKALNMVGELAEDKPIPAADFKRVTGGDVLQGRHPTHRPFEFVNTASHVFNTNHLPYTKDRSDAFFSRWIILEFKNPIPETERIDDFEKSILDNELPQILHWAMEGAQRVIQSGKFTYPQSHLASMKKWRVQSSTVAECLLDEGIFKIGGDEEMPRANFFAVYRAWCFDNGRRSMGRNKALDELQSPEVTRITGIQVTRNNKGEWIVKGVRRISYADKYSHLRSRSF